MKTYKGIQVALEKFFTAVKPAHENLETKEEYDAAIEQARNSLNEDFARLSESIPTVFPMKLDVEGVVEKGKDAFFETVEEIAKKRLRLPLLYSGKQERNPYCEVPIYFNWETGVETVEDNGYIVPFLLDLLLSMPIGTVKLTLIANGEDTSCFDPIISNLDSQYFDGRIVSQQEERDLLEKLKKRRFSVIQKYADYPQYCQEHNNIEQPYEVLVVLRNRNYYYNNRHSELLDFIGKNHLLKSGVYVIYVEDKTSSCPHIFSDERIQQWCFEYLNDKLSKSSPSDIDKIVREAYQPIEDVIEVNVGSYGSKQVSFKLNTVDHVHAFIVGQSGSGKSVFLHNVISNAMLKYAPEDLQLYLLDFKLGGVEFNRYKGIKQVRALLVDNSDQQITLEILKTLRDNMTDRGRRLRNSGYNKIDEYNNAFPNQKMPHILVVADECHELFLSKDETHYISRQITEILVKIAKEGRSQGVHLIFATQTLAGTDISNDILHNISDFYLLKCSVSDSERLVSRSSEITAKLNTGEILYHHADQDVQFKAYYTDKESADKLVKTAIQKATDHKSNGEYYFNGSLQYGIDKAVIKSNKDINKHPVAYLGKTISLNLKDIAVTLPNDFSENILVLGLNDEEQATRTTLDILQSMAIASQEGQLNQRICIIDCQPDKHPKYQACIDQLVASKQCEIIRNNDRGAFIKRLAEDIKNGNTKPMSLFILGQDRFRELRLDLDLVAKADDETEKLSPFGLPSFSNGGGESIKTYRKALSFILDRGPELGVHTILQLEKVTNLLFEDMMTGREINNKFKHWIMLRSDDKTAGRLALPNEIRLEFLEKDPERLRAYYYSGTTDNYTLFTPYVIK